MAVFFTISLPGEGWGWGLPSASGRLSGCVARRRGTWAWVGPPAGAATAQLCSCGFQAPTQGEVVGKLLAWPGSHVWRGLSKGGKGPEPGNIYRFRVVLLICPCFSHFILFQQWAFFPLPLRRPSGEAGSGSSSLMHVWFWAALMDRGNFPWKSAAILAVPWDMHHIPLRESFSMGP